MVARVCLPPRCSPAASSTWPAASRPAPCCSQSLLATRKHARSRVRSHAGTEETSSNVPPGTTAAHLRAASPRSLALHAPRALVVLLTQPPEQSYERQLR